MRIAFTVHKFPPHSLGGTEIYTWSLGRALAKAGHQVHVFYPFVDPSPEEVHVEKDGMHLWRVAISSDRVNENPALQFWHTLRDTAIEREFQDFLAHVQPQLVHFQHLQGVSARLIALAAGKPRLATLHDYWYFCANSQLVQPDRAICTGPRWGWNCVDCGTARADLSWLRTLRPILAPLFLLRNQYLHWLLKGIDLFIAPSEFLRQQYIRQGLWADRILTIENGLDYERLQEPPADLRLAHPPARSHFGFLGTLAWQKGVHVLVEAFNHMPKDVALTIYGNKDAFPEYSARVMASAKHPGIRFAGQLDYRLVGTALRQLDCLVVPSLWYENSPLVIQEAFGLSVPVVASRLGALAEKVLDEQTGRLFNPGDSVDLARVLLDLVNNPQQLATMRENIRPAPTIDEHAREIASIYRTLLNRR